MTDPAGTPRVSVFGLGKLGFPVAACLASRGIPVVGVDSNPMVLDAFRTGRPPAGEPGLAELWPSARERFSATSDGEQAVRNTSITFVLVPTPSGPDGGFRLDAILEACKAIGRGLRDKAEPHTVAINSTVMPGSLESHVRPALEHHSARTCGRDFALCYNPQFVALGSVLRDFTAPDFTLLGESHEGGGDAIEALYRRVLDKPPAVVRMNLVNAEVVKLALNTYVTMKISFANLVARLCEQLPGGNADVVTAALGRDTRIGAKCLKGALGYGGPCFPRDNAALAALARSLHVPADLPEATDAMNRAQIAILAENVRAWTPKERGVSILGLSYKPGTSVVDESQGVALALTLARGGTRVSVYDPAAMGEARRVLGDAVTYCDSADECARAGGTIVIATPWPEFAGLRLTNGSTVVDCWRMLNRTRLPPSTTYIALGERLPAPR